MRRMETGDSVVGRNGDALTTTSPTVTIRFSSSTFTNVGAEVVTKNDSVRTPE